MPEQVFSKDRVITTGDFETIDSGIEAGPSAYHDTETPYLVKVLDLPQDVIATMELTLDIKEVDGFVLDLIKERKWGDTAQSYKDILDELKINLNIHKNTDSLELMERLIEGVRLLKLQKMHKRREADIQKQINNIRK